MADEKPYGRVTQKAPAVSDVHVLWITAGLSCDGDTVSITAATQPSIEDVLLGAIPGLPKVHLHNPVLAYEVGDDFLKYWYQAEQGKLDPFVLVVEGRSPTRASSRKATGRRSGPTRTPASRSPPTSGSRGLRPRRWPSWPAAPARPTAAFTRWPGNPTGAMGLADFLGWQWRSKAGIPIVNVPGCPVQPDNFMETILYLLYQAAGLAPMIPLDERSGRPGCSARRCTKAAIAPATTSRATSPPNTAPRSASSSSAAGARWSTATCPSAAGWPASAAAPTSAASASAARCRASPTSSCRSWTSRPAAVSRRRWPSVYGRTVTMLRQMTHGHPEQGAEVASLHAPSSPPVTRPGHVTSQRSRRR